MNFKDIKIILIEFVKLCYSRLLKITQDRMFLTVATNKSPENIAFIAHLSTLIWKISSPNPLGLHKNYLIKLNINEIGRLTMKPASYGNYRNECIIAIVSRNVTKRYSKRISDDQSLNRKLSARCHFIQIRISDDYLTTIVI